MFEGEREKEATETLRRTVPGEPRGRTGEGESGLPRYLREGAAGNTPAGGPSTAAATGGSSTAGGSTPGASAGSATAASCPTPEEEQRKERFRRRSFSAPNFRPSAGFGKFDAFYWPADSLMAAIVRMKFRYVQADNTPPLFTLLGMLLNGEDIGRFFWTEAEKRTFAREYERRITERWSFAHTFRSTKPCWPFIAEPYVTASVVDDPSRAHFDVTVHKSAGPNIDYKSAFGARNPGTTGWRGTGDLYSSDVQENADFNSRQVARSERQRLERAVATYGASPVLFGRNSAEVPLRYRIALLLLAAAMRAKNPTDPLIPVTLRGFASAEGSVARNRRLSRQRAEAVARILRDAGAPQPLTIRAMGPVGALNDASNRKVEIVPSRTFENTYAGNPYSVAEHEFGHTLGLPDEYVNRTSGALGAKQATFDSLARAAGVSPPDRWGDKTSSQMSAGVDVLPRHYLTLWEALGYMTQPDITRDQWRID